MFSKRNKEIKNPAKFPKLMISSDTSVYLVCKNKGKLTQYLCTELTSGGSFNRVGEQKTYLKIDGLEDLEGSLTLSNSNTNL